MGIIKDFIEYRKVKKLVAEVENVDEEAEAKKQLDEILKKYPNLRSNVLNYAKESEQIEDEIIAETLTENIETLVDKQKIDQEEKDLLKVGVEFMGDNGEDFPDEYLNKVATAASNSKHIDMEKELNILRNFNDEEEKQKYLAERLKKIYIKMNPNMLETDIVNQIKNFREVVKSCKKISDWERKIVGKKIAFNYINYGSTQLRTLSEIISTEKMFQMNMPKIVDNEYKKIIKKNKEDFKEKRYEYNQQSFRLELLNEMARNVAYKYNKTGELIIPKSEQMKKISIEEEEFFINKIDTLSDKKLRENEIISIKGRMRGNLEEIVKLEEVINMVNNLPVERRNEAIKQMKEIIEDEKSRDIYDIIKKVGLDKSFESMDEKGIEDSFKVLKTTLDERKGREDKKVNEHSDVSDDDEISR